MVLKAVYPSQGPTTSSSIDIVAVHGLGGDLVNTWTHPKSKKFWLKDFLPLQIPDARVLTFGYNADAAFGQSTAEIVDHAKSLLSSLVDKREEQDEIRRPLVFIAHSLGGIVVKQALFQARLEPRYQSIRDATIGLIFLGTPHRGSDKATYGKVLASVAQFVSHRPPPRLLTALQTNSEVLLRLTTDFRFQLPDYQVYSFFEQRPMKGFSSLIVEKHSALLEAHHEEQIPVDADHSEMCKFETDGDETFEKIYKRIRRMRDRPQRATIQESVSYNTHFEVPHLLSTVFTGRDEDLRCLTAAFASRQSLQGHHQRRFVLFGLGGSGKTQICLKYVQSHRERYWGVFWVDASSDDRLRQGFAQIALLLQVDETIDSVKRKLANTAQTWLLVLDNADNPDLSLSPYLPAGSRGDIIITSRNPECQQYNTGGYRNVGQLSPNDSVSLLNKLIYGSTNSSELVTHALQNIAAALGYLALALVQAGAYIRETSCSPQEYVDIYNRRTANLLQYQPKHAATDYRYSVYATWQLSVDVIESKQDAVSLHALRLLSLLGFYHPDQIPIQMFYNTWRSAQTDQEPDHLPWKKTGLGFSNYQESVRLSINRLSSFSLITRNVDESLSLHHLVHEWCRSRLSQDERRLSYRRALSLLTCSVAWKYETKDYTFRRSLVSHVHELIRARGHQGDLSDKEKLQEWPVLSLILAENGSTRHALQLTEEVVALQKSQLGDDHPDTLRSMHSLAIRYGEAGRRAEALQLAEEVVALYKSQLGDDHPDTLLSMHNLAIHYSEAGRRAEALKLAEEVVALHKSRLGDDHPDTLQSIKLLAYVTQHTDETLSTSDLSGPNRTILPSHDFSNRGLIVEEEETEHLESRGEHGSTKGRNLLRRLLRLKLRAGPP